VATSPEKVYNDDFPIAVNHSNIPTFETSIANPKAKVKAKAWPR
jgi:hypothetical protein